MFVIPSVQSIKFMFLSLLFEVSRLVVLVVLVGRWVGGCKRNAALSNVDPSRKLHCCCCCFCPLSLLLKTPQNACYCWQPRYHFFGHCIALFVFLKKIASHCSSFRHQIQYILFLALPNICSDLISR